MIFLKIILKGEVSPSLQPHVIPAQAGISLWHTLPLLAGTPRNAPTVKKTGNISYSPSRSSLSNSARYPAISSSCMMVVILFPASLLDAPQWKSFSLSVPKSR